MPNKEKAKGLAFALITVLVWGSTFIFSKQLLAYYAPLQIMVVRFIMAYIMLLCLKPKLFRLSLKEEALFALLGMLGCTLYFFAENSALTYTLASNVSIILAATPMCTAIVAHFLGEERFRRSTLFSFLIAFSGVVLVVFNGTFVLQLDPRGDLLSIAAAVCWAFYSVLLTRHTAKYDTILVTRRIMLWGALTATPILLLTNPTFPLEPLKNPTVLFCFLFLGLLGSSLCYLLWNKAFRLLGVVATNNFIYLQPFWTIVVAYFVLGEPISPLSVLGAVLIVTGIAVSKRRSRNNT